MGPEWLPCRARPPAGLGRAEFQLLPASSAAPVCVLRPRTSLQIVPLTSPVSRVPVHALLSRLVPSTLPTQTPQRGNLTGLAYPVWAESACRATDIQLPLLSSRLHRTGPALGEASPSLHRGGRHHLGRRELRGRPSPAARRVADTVPRRAWTAWLRPRGVASGGRAAAPWSSASAWW